MENKEIVDRGVIAKDLFFEGYNCSQAVFCAFEDLTGLNREASARIASSFGGGMGRLREVCGAVSGALLALGMIAGYSDPSDPEAKKEHYLLVREFARRFADKNGSIICRDLLKNVSTTPGAEPEARTPEFYKKRPCPEIIADAARIAAELLKENEEQGNK